MIPKKIHYCWFGGKPLNPLGEKCRASWKKYFPDYEIIEWNESNFDVNCCRYVREAYEAKKWAFVSDYARFKILFEQGGVYFDTDVEVIKSFNDILEKGNFMGCENKVAAVNPSLGLAVAPGLGLAVAPGLGLIKEILEDYEKDSFFNPDGSLNLTTIVTRTTNILKRHGLQNINGIQTVAEIDIYPVDYFCPIDRSSGKLVITKNTHSIHRYAGSWETNGNKFRGKVYRLISRTFGERIAEKIRKVIGRKQ